MRATVRLFWVVAGFSFLLSAVYTVWAALYESQELATEPSGTEGLRIEWVGSIGLALVGVLATLIAFYVGRQYKSQGGELPEDRSDANIDDGEAEQGHFSPWSWWPLVLAGSAALTFLGLAVGVWISFIGGSILVVALVGWTYEYYRGYFGH